MSNPFANIQQFNPAELGMQAFQQGMQMGNQIGGQNALSQFAANPEDPEAFKGLAKYKPEMAMQVRQQQQQQQAMAQEREKQDIIKGAAIVRQIGVRDQATWEQALATAQRVGIDISKINPQYDPASVQSLVALADTFSPQKQNEAPSAVREYEYYKTLGPEEQANYGRLRTMTAPRIFGSDASGYNAFDPSGLGAPPPQQGQPQQITDKAQYDALPAGAQYVAPDGTVRTKGGQSGGASTGGFPPAIDPLAPRF